MGKTILHCDCNSFFASAETATHPEYAGVPMAVCGSREDRHGIVLAKNELAKACGIKTGEVIWSAKLKCPNLTVVEPHYQLYSQLSAEINRIYCEYTDRTEPFGIDETWLDVTGSMGLFGDGAAIAAELRERARRELGITISVGVSFTKSFAKLGSDYKKPDATTLISQNNYREIVFPLPAADLLFVGRHTAARLKSIGILTIGDIALSDPETLALVFGKNGKAMYIMANGMDETPVSKTVDCAREKSVGNGFTFRRDLLGREDAGVAFSIICDQVSSRMRRSGVKCKTVTIFVRDTSLSVFSRQKKLKTPASYAKILKHTALELLDANWNYSVPIRSLSVIASDFISDDLLGEQLCFLYTPEELDAMKEERLGETIDRIRNKYGSKLIIPACSLNNCYNL